MIPGIYQHIQFITGGHLKNQTKFITVRNVLLLSVNMYNLMISIIIIDEYHITEVFFPVVMGFHNFSELNLNDE